MEKDERLSSLASAFRARSTARQTSPPPSHYVQELDFSLPVPNSQAQLQMPPGIATTAQQSAAYPFDSKSSDSSRSMNPFALNDDMLLFESPSSSSELDMLRASKRLVDETVTSPLQRTGMSSNSAPSTHSSATSPSSCSPKMSALSFASAAPYTPSNAHISPQNNFGSANNTTNSSLIGNVENSPNVGNMANFGATIGNLGVNMGNSNNMRNSGSNFANLSTTYSQHMKFPTSISAPAVGNALSAASSKNGSNTNVSTNSTNIRTGFGLGSLGTAGSSQGKTYSSVVQSGAPSAAPNLLHSGTNKTPQSLGQYNRDAPEHTVGANAGANISGARASRNIVIGKDYLDQSTKEIECGIANGLCVMTHPNVAFETSLSQFLPLANEVADQLLLDLKEAQKASLTTKKPSNVAVGSVGGTNNFGIVPAFPLVFPMSSTTPSSTTSSPSTSRDNTNELGNSSGSIYSRNSTSTPNSVSSSGSGTANHPNQYQMLHQTTSTNIHSQNSFTGARFGAVCRNERSRVHYYLHVYDPNLPVHKLFERLMLHPATSRLDSVSRIYPVTAAAHPDVDFAQMCIQLISNHALTLKVSNATSSVGAGSATYHVSKPTASLISPIGSVPLSAYGSSVPGINNSSLQQTQAGNSNISSNASSSASSGRNGPNNSTHTNQQPKLTIGLALESHRASDFAKELSAAILSSLPFIEIVERNPMHCDLMLSSCYFNSVFLTTLWEPINTNDLNNYRPGEMKTWAQLHPSYSPRTPFYPFSKAEQLDLRAIAPPQSGLARTQIVSPPSASSTPVSSSSAAASQQLMHHLPSVAAITSTRASAGSAPLERTNSHLSTASSAHLSSSSGGTHFNQGFGTHPHGPIGKNFKASAQETQGFSANAASTSSAPLLNTNIDSATLRRARTISSAAAATGSAGNNGANSSSAQSASAASAQANCSTSPFKNNNGAGKRKRH